MDPRAEALLAFWFGPLDGDGLAAPERAARWFDGGPAFDRELAERFGADHGEARAGRLDRWADLPRGRLALVLHLDQLSRNLFRGSADAFGTDAHALALARGGLARGEDAGLAPIERVFLYLPFEHSEALEDQEVSVARFRALAEAAPPHARETFAAYLDYAVRHRDVIARFGRFPHRNAVLGRASTAEELAFLATPGSSF
jgi:uncharacterized protein (DUF924 family)